MPNIIAKKLNITLDTIKQKLIFLKSSEFTYVVGDSVEITANIIENGLPKSLEGCYIRAIGIRNDNSSFEQTDRITIEDSLNGVIKIYPDINKFNILGKVIVGLIIEDADETINIQRFGFEITDSMASAIISEGSESIETLGRLNKLLDEYESDLTAINQQVIDLQSDVSLKLNELQGNVDLKTTKINNDFTSLEQSVNGGFTALEQSINNDIELLSNKIKGVDDTINYELTKRIKLTPYRLSGSSFIYFTTDTFDIPASELLKKSYVVSLGGIVEVGNYNTSIGVVNFYKTNGKIYPMWLTLMDRMVGGKSLSPSVVFNDLTGEILPNATGFKLMVKSNILKTLNLDSEIYCTLTPIGN